MLEMVIALAIMAIIFATIMPLFRNMQSSWSSDQAAAETLQNARVLMDHLARNLAKAVRITAVSDSSTTNGYIQFEENDKSNFRYDIANNYVRFGPVGALSDLAGPASQLQFTCYDALNLDTPIPDVADANSIRFVKVQTTLANAHPTAQDETFTTSIYIRANANKYEEGIGKKTPFEFNIYEGRAPALAQIDNTHYLCAYRSWDWSGRAVVLMVNPGTWAISSGTTLEYDTSIAKTPALAKIDDDHYLCAYEGWSSDGYAVILAVDPITWTVSKGTRFEFDDEKGKIPALAKIDSTHYLCAYRGEDDDGWATVLTANTETRTVTKETPFEFDTQKCGTPALAKIDDAHYLCAYEGKDDDGWVVVLTVNMVTWSISKETPFEFDNKKGKYPALSMIDDTHYLCAYSGDGDDGWATVLKIDAAGWTITKETPFEFDSQNGKSPILSKIDNTRYLCTYNGEDDDGWSVVLAVDPAAWTVGKGTPFEYDTSKGKAPALEKVDDNHYLCAYQGNNDDGWSAVLELDMNIRP